MLTHQIFDSKLPTLGRQTVAAWATNPNKGLLIFVHGFNGAPTKTWAEFPVQIRQQAEFENWDAIFFGYDGLNTAADSSAATLRTLLNATEDPKSLYESSDASPYAARAHPTSYQRIVLIAHSLGAIVSRRAMLDGYRERTPAKWAKKVELFNFAPAHRGAKLMALVLHSFGPAAPVLGMAQLFSRLIVLRDLDEAGQTVARLERETVAAVAAGRLNLRALGSVWAEDDRIVTNGSFADDPAPDASFVISDKDHSSVCKPDARYKDPIAAVRMHL